MLGAATSALKTFCAANKLSVSTLEVMEGGSALSGELDAQAKALRNAVGNADLTQRIHVAVAHAIMLLSILRLLREEALSQQPNSERFMAEFSNATTLDQSCFDTIACYSSDALGIQPGGMVFEPAPFRVLEAFI